MAVKRRVEGTDDVSSPKKHKSGMGPELWCCNIANLLEDSVQDDSFDADLYSDDGDDYKVNFTDNGTRRADSEARRQWNYVCTIDGCGQRFNRPCRLDAHMRSHTKERPFACSESGCDKNFPRKDHLQRHIKNTHSDPVDVRKFPCDWEGCDQSFTSNGRMQRHRKVHESKFYCTGYPPCKEAFRKETALSAHIKSQHEEVKPYPCTHIDEDTGSVCPLGYLTQAALYRHITRKHTGVESEDGLFCMICVLPDDRPEPITADMLMDVIPLSFASQEELQAHISSQHPPACNKCGKQFKSDAILRSHFNTVHTDPSQQPQFSCPEPDCDSVFNRKHNLAVHIQTVHEKQARYTCTPSALHDSKHKDLKNWSGDNACGAPFKAKSSLDQHVRTHHLGLGNRKQQRKAAKSKKQPEASTLSMLTGVGYDTNREIPCLVKSCLHRFYRDRDLVRHLRAEHAMSDDEIEEGIAERDALTGGQFWIGGLDDSMGYFDSVTPSMPETPAHYFMDDGMHTTSFPMKGFGMQDHQFDGLSLLREHEEMDLAMGLGEVPPATDVQEGLQWGIDLAPVGQYNMEHE